MQGLAYVAALTLLLQTGGVGPGSASSSADPAAGTVSGAQWPGNALRVDSAPGASANLRATQRDDATERPITPNPQAFTHAAQRREYSGGSDDLLKQFEKSNVPAAFANKPTWQGIDLCGLNCLYVVLRLSAFGTSYTDLRRLAGTVPKGGFNMSQLKAIAEKAKVEVDVIRGDPARIKEMQPPVIVHMGEPDQVGHFICFVRRAGDALVFADGTTGGEFTVGQDGAHPLSGITRRASGYMLVPSRQPRSARAAWRWILRGTSGSALIAACTFIVLSELRGRAAKTI